MQGATGTGLATFADGGRVLDTFYPEPRLGDGGEAGTREIEPPAEWAAATGEDERREVRVAAVETTIADLAEPPRDAHDAYLRLHLLSHRLIRPREANLDGIFGVLNNVAWTNHGPVDPAAVPAVQRRVRAAGEPFQVFGVDKFPRMTDYVVPAGGR